MFRCVTSLSLSRTVGFYYANVCLLSFSLVTSRSLPLSSLTASLNSLSPITENWPFRMLMCVWSVHWSGYLKWPSREKKWTFSCHFYFCFVCVFVFCCWTNKISFCLCSLSSSSSSSLTWRLLIACSHCHFVSPTAQQLTHLCCCSLAFFWSEKLKLLLISSVDFALVDLVFHIKKLAF